MYKGRVSCATSLDFQKGDRKSPWLPNPVDNFSPEDVSQKLEPMAQAAAAGPAMTRVAPLLEL